MLASNAATLKDNFTGLGLEAILMPGLPLAFSCSEICSIKVSDTNGAKADLIVVFSSTKGAVALERVAMIKEHLQRLKDLDEFAAVRHQ